MSIWQWLMQISKAPEIADPLLVALARGHACDGIGDAAQRAALLELFCTRDLLMQQPDGSYAFQVPLLARWGAASVKPQRYTDIERCRSRN